MSLERTSRSGCAANGTGATCPKHLGAVVGGASDSCFSQCLISRVWRRCEPHRKCRPAESEQRQSPANSSHDNLYRGLGAARFVGLVRHGFCMGIHQLSRYHTLVERCR